MTEITQLLSDQALKSTAGSFDNVHGGLHCRGHVARAFAALRFGELWNSA